MLWREYMLTQRQRYILDLIVGDYIRLATPIASESLARNHNVGVSSATIRNEVAFLEDEGYINRPHASAGSVPEDKAYRRYVESVLVDDADAIPPATMQAASRQLADVENDVDAWGDAAASLLAQLVGNLGIATFPKMKQSRIKHLELVPVQDFLAVLIVVLEQARLRKQLVRLDDPVETRDLETISQRLRREVLGLTRDQIESKLMHLSPIEESLIEATVLILREEDVAPRHDRSINGLRNLLGQPEFVDHEKVQSIVGSVEDGTLVEAVLDEAPEGGVVEVVIGEEHTGDVLRPLSVVIAQYGIPGQAVGSVGAVGPTRMEYTRAITGVRFVSSMMSRLVERVYG